ncbi:hypothetical protein ACFY8V_06890 [Streptomyces californicus]|uniref:WXG100 family type VII secretion target n=1 Tax=Streptomyces TaxID=1883 RepID=UPI000BEF4CE7|nr:WXG100 family type VII secretion target [Streptomyces sp. sk226]
MSEEARPELTPAERREEDRARVYVQVTASDVSVRQQRFTDFLLRRGGEGGVGGRTSFEGHRLNTMIDLVENAKPEDLESAGKALWQARDAIRGAAKELEDHIAGVDWQGESGDAFRKWGTGLVAHARKLEDFADAAGTQITVAGTGLASVRKAMPPRDTRPKPDLPHEVDLMKQAEGNPEYDTAVRVERNRQEAINQLNRLASFYSISEQWLAGQEAPEFRQEMGVDVPPPARGPRPSPGSSPTEGAEVLGGDAGGGAPKRATSDVSDIVGASGARYLVEPPGPAPVLDRSVSTEVNSVVSPMAPPTNTNTPPSSAPTLAAGPAGAPPSLLPPAPVASLRGGAPRSTGPTGVPRTVGQTGPGQGRAQPTGSGPTARGQSGLPLGRPGPLGDGGTSFTGRPPVGPQPTAAGQSGVTGGRPMVGQSGTPAVGGPRAGGANGIVGGAPQRVPQSGAAAGGPARPGVVGGRGTVAAAPRAGGRASPAPGANGVVGVARKAASAGPNTKGFTPGGSGLVRGPESRRNSGREDENKGSTRPDYLTEDEDTWNVGRRGAVPPVVE